MELSKTEKDCYRTPKYMVNWIKMNFLTNVDGCADCQNAIHGCYIGLDQDNEKISDFFKFDMGELEDEIYWNEGSKSKPRIFINPPYSNPLPFIQRAIDLMKQDVFVVMLLPADKSTKWYEEINKNATEVIDIIGGRVNFINPVTGKVAKGNNKSSLVAVFNPFEQGFITREINLKFIKEKFGKI